MASCIKCNGQGLVSTGAVPHDLEVGSKVTCPDCNGTGSVQEAVPVTGNVEESAVIPAQEVTPKAPEEVGGETSGELPEILPKAGDKCLTVDDIEGTLVEGDDGKLICVPF